MDKERAKFILTSFRPDGADAANPDFAEALATAMENRDLGEWFAQERAFDGAFAEALAAVQLPENLRDEVIACLAIERGDFPQAEDADDALLVGAMASIMPPPQLRDRIIQAMDHTAASPREARSFWRKFAIPLAAAAGIVFAFLMARPDEDSLVANNAKVRPEVIEASFIKTVSAPDFSLEIMGEDTQLLIAHLKNKQLPYPTSLPARLEALKGKGCRELNIDGRRGSLICYNLGKDGLIHLITFLRNDLEADSLSNKPRFSRQGEWASAQWQDGQRVYLLMKKTEVATLAEYF